MISFSGQEVTDCNVVLDSFYIPNFLDKLNIKHEDVLQQMNQKMLFIPRQSKEMLYRGNALSREKFFLTRNKSGTIYKYTYPGFQYASMQHYKYFEDLPIVHEIIQIIEKQLLYNYKPVTVTQAIGTRYIQITDNIGFHSDKIKDILEDSPILTLSFGDVRELHLLDNSTGQVCQVLVLEPGSLFILGPKTNNLMKHSLVKISDEKKIKRVEPPRPRISIVLRHIKTEISLSSLETKLKKSTKKKQPKTVSDKIPLKKKTLTPKIAIKLKEEEEVHPV